MELFAEDRKKVNSLLGVQSALSVHSVINGTLPGHVYVDNMNNPQGFLIKTPECNLLGGVGSAAFANEVKQYLDYFDSVVFAGADWAELISVLHPNCGLRAFERIYYTHLQSHELNYPVNDDVHIDVIHFPDLSQLDYDNKALVQEWIAITNMDDADDVPVAAVVVKDNVILSCAALDCIDGDAVEVGIKTLAEHRRKGYATLATATLIRRLRAAGINKIGWHCVATNMGSIRVAERCGFNAVTHYVCWYPYPPIENKTDLTADEWSNLGAFYKAKADIAADQYWQAARCYAQALNKRQVIFCIARLIECHQFWFLDYVEDGAEFDFVRHDVDWIALLQCAVVNRDA